MRRLIEERLRRGDSPEDIRRLLKIPDIEDRPPPSMDNQGLLTAIPLPSNEAPFALYPDNPTNEQSDTNVSSVEYFTNPMTTYPPAPSNNAGTYPGQFTFSNLSPNVFPNAATPYSLGPQGAAATSSSNEYASPSWAVFQPFDGNSPSQVQSFIDPSNGFNPFLTPSGSQFM
jgi:hypothetical protein